MQNLDNADHGAQQAQPFVNPIAPAVRNLRPRKKGTLVADFDVLMPALGATLKGCTLHATPNASKFWWLPPGAEYLDANGVRRFRQLVAIDDDVGEAFKAAVLDLAMAAFEEGGR